MAYENLPGSTVELIDGRLRNFVANDDPIVLLMGTASSGFTNVLYTVNNVNSALNEFGRTSELAKGLVEVRDGGAQNIVLFRLPGEAPVLDIVGADRAGAVEAGYTITPVLASTEAGTRYGIAYQHAENFSSGAAAADSSRVVGKLCIVDLEDDELVWYGDATSGTIEDFGLMDVVQGALYAGTGTDHETLTISTSVAGPLVTGGDITLRISGVEVTVTLAAADTDTVIAGKIRDAVADVAGGVTDELSAFNVSVLAVTDFDISADGAVDPTSLILLHHPDHPTQGGLPARPILELVSADAAISPAVTVEASVGLGNSHREALDIGVLPLDPTEPFALNSGGQFVALADAKAQIDAIHAFWTGGGASRLTYAAGDTGESLSLMERYEKLYEASSLLTFEDFNIVHFIGANFDALNVADLSGAEITARGLDLLTDYPVAGSNADVLGKLAIVEDKANFSYDFFWDTDSDAAAEIGSPTGSLTFHEVNFAHLLATFCYEASRDYQFCHGFVGASLPRALSPRGIREYYGYLPEYTWDAGNELNVVASSSDNGIGLLGHKLIGGKFGYHFSQEFGGMPLTADGFFDTSTSESNLVKDDEGSVIDLGAYVTLVGAMGHIRNEFDSTPGGYLANLGAYIAGLTAALPSNTNITDQTLSDVRMRYRMPATVADDATGHRLVVLLNDAGAVKVVDGPTNALPTSDFTRLSTMRIIADVVEQLRLAARPFIGRGMDTRSRLALDTSFQAVMQKSITEDRLITAGNTLVTQTRAQRVAGEFDVDVSLTPVFETRRFRFRVALSA